MDHERKDLHTTPDAAKEGALKCCLMITNVYLLLFYFIWSHYTACGSFVLQKDLDDQGWNSALPQQLCEPFDFSET